MGEPSYSASADVGCRVSFLAHSSTPVSSQDSASASEPDTPSSCLDTRLNLNQNASTRLSAQLREGTKMQRGFVVRLQNRRMSRRSEKQRRAHIYSCCTIDFAAVVWLKPSLGAACSLTFTLMLRGSFFAVINDGESSPSLVNLKAVLSWRVSW